MFRTGYCSNGLAHHRIAEAVELVAELGFDGIAITPDVGELDLLDLAPGRVARLRAQLDRLGLAAVVETGARYVLDPRRKHRPNLLDAAPADRARRVDYYRRAIDLAAALKAPVVSLWSGAADEGERAEPERSWERLAGGLTRVLDHARGSGVRIGFEPEPDFFVERPDSYLELVRRLGARGAELGLTLDLGHLVATSDAPAAPWIRRLAPHLVHVQVDDALPGRHEHLQLGSGALDLADCVSALLETRYAGMLAVELGRDSHRGPEMAREALARLRTAGVPGRPPC